MRLLFIPILLIFALSNSIKNTSTITSERYSETLANPIIPEVDRIIQDEIIKQNVVGAAVGIVKNGRIVHLNGYGHTSLDRTEEITVNTIFRWASISKPLTAVAALQLDEQNPSYSIYDTVANHVSYWPSEGAKGNITILQLLSHRAGIIHYRSTGNCPCNSDPNPDEDMHDDGPFHPRNAVAIFKDQDLCFNPGSLEKYSTFGYNLLAASIEDASGQSYANWVNNNIAVPLGMNSLRQATGELNGYNVENGRLVDRIDGSKGCVLPGGGWESGIRDLALFGNALIHNTLLDNTSRMWNEVTGNDTYRLGINRRPNESRIYHGGTHNNLRTYMELYPNRADKLGVVIYLNGRHANRFRLARRIVTEMGVSNRQGGDAPIVAECTSQSDRGRYSVIWRKTGKDVLLRKGLSNDDFAAEWYYLRRNGYYLDDFEAYIEGGELRWDGIYRKGTGRNGMWRNFSKEGFYQKYEEQVENNSRLVDVETYLDINGNRKWAGLFRPGLGRHAFVQELNTSDFGDKRREFAASGMKLIDIEAYTVNGNLRWAGVWIEGEDRLLNRNYTREDFGELRTERRNAGWKLIDIESYDTNNGERWAGIWERSDEEERLNRNFHYCNQEDDEGNSNCYGIIKNHNQWRNDGFELIDWERN